MSMTLWKFFLSVMYADTTVCSVSNLGIWGFCCPLADTVEWLHIKKR